LSERIVEVAAGMSAGAYADLEKTGVVHVRPFGRSDDGSADGASSGDM
jgi:hypothetical protein